MIGKLLGALAAVEAAAAVGIAVIAASPEFSGERKKFLRKAEALIAELSAKPATIDASLNATALRAVKMLGKKVEAGWGLDDASAIELIISRMAAPLAKDLYNKSAAAATDIIDRAADSVAGMFDDIINWPAQKKKAA